MLNYVQMIFSPKFAINWKLYPFPKRQILDFSTLKELADNNFKFDENGRKSIPMGRKHCGKMRNCSLRAITPFPTVLSKDLYCRHVKTRACLGKGYIILLCDAKQNSFDCWMGKISCKIFKVKLLPKGNNYCLSTKINVPYTTEPPSFNFLQNDNWYRLQMTKLMWLKNWNLCWEDKKT